MEPESSKSATDDLQALEEQIWSELRACHDPEISVNIVDLGLIYSVKLTLEPSGYKVWVKMTLTSPACSMGDIIIGAVKHRILALVGVQAVDVETVFDPPWDRSMMSEQAKLDLGLF